MADLLKNVLGLCEAQAEIVNLSQIVHWQKLRHTGA
jgi:hypothetical protein